MGKLNWLSIFKESFSSWSRDKVPMLSAALSYYTVFSLGPLLLVIIGLVGLFFSRSNAEKEIFSQIKGLLGSDAAASIQTVVKNVSKPGQSTLSIIIGSATLLLGASAIFEQLKDALNQIWRVKPKPNLGLWLTVRRKFLSLSMVLVVGFLLLVSLVMSSLITFVSSYLGNLIPLPPAVLFIVDLLVSTGILTVFFTLLLKVLPDAEIPWKSILPAALVTAVLFSVGKYAIGLYIGNGKAASGYGAAGSLIIILLWVYYASQILLFGAEVSKTLYLKNNRHIKPKPHALTGRTEEEIGEKYMEKRIAKGIEKTIRKGLKTTAKLQARKK